MSGVVAWATATAHCCLLPPTTLYLERGEEPARAVQPRHTRGRLDQDHVHLVRGRVRVGVRVRVYVRARVRV